MRSKDKNSTKILMRAYAAAEREQEETALGALIMKNAYPLMALSAVKGRAKGERRARVCAREYLSQRGYVYGDDLTAYLTGYMTRVLLSLTELFALQRIMTELCVEKCVEICGRYLHDLRDDTLLTTLKNALESIEALRREDMARIAAKVSFAEKLLSEDAVFAAMAEESQSYYRRTVTKTAALLGLTEKELIKRAQKLEKKNGRHFFYYIGGKGIDELISALERTPARARLSRVAKRSKLPMYIFTVTALSLSICTGFAFILHTWRGDAALCAVAGLLMLLPVYTVVKRAVDDCCMKLLRPAHIPRMEGDIEAGTAVVMPALVTCREDVQKKLNDLETSCCCNSSENIFFALLCDFPGGEELSEEERATIEEAQAAVEELNARYGRMFGYYHRRRIRNSSGEWMGAERKRGAITALCKLIYSGESGEFEAYTRPPRHIKYVIVLDSDTQLPRDCAKKLVGAMEHPLNRPVLSPDKSRVMEGYGVLQPQISVDVESANVSVFSRLFSGEAGLDIYTCAVSNVYQDMFGEGIFTGKGIFDLETYMTVLSSAFPKERVLSHDLLEGAYLRCGLISDVVLYDGFPRSYLSYMARSHRWIRGDVQLLPWLSDEVENEKGKWVKNPINALSKFKILDNLLRAAMPVSSLVLLLYGYALFGGGAFIAAIVAFSSQLYELMYSCGAMLLSRFRAKEGGVTAGDLTAGIADTLMSFGLRVSTLPYEAIRNADAITRALYRRYISKKKLLEWVTAEQSDKLQKGTLKAAYSAMTFSPIMGTVTFLTGMFFLSMDLPLLLLGAAFQFSPLVAYDLSRPRAIQKLTPGKRQRELLSDVFVRTWRFFDELSTREHNWLIPDNIQIEPATEAVRRTSVTNIGYGLIAPVLACRRGLIDSGEMLSRVCRITDTIERLPKKRGMYYNWYRTDTLEPIDSDFISSVDMGNLACYMVAAARGIKLLAGDGGEELCARILELFEMMDFSQLYDDELSLLAIGMDARTGKRTKNCYDLLASETRQASFIAIAKGDIPQKNWFSLERPVVKVHGYSALISWSGSCFEYLMPELLMKSIPNTLMGECCKAVFAAQRGYARMRRIPFGISESGYYKFDKDDYYQYKAFSIPYLAMKRPVARELVVSPYSTFLLMLVNLQESFRNMTQLIRTGAYGIYGFYEAIDYTAGEARLVRSYLAHHQGMILCALSNLLDDGFVWECFCSDPRVRGALPLLKERAVSHCPLLPVRPLGGEERAEEGHTVWRAHFPTALALSNGRMTTVVDDRGCGFSLAGGKLITRRSGDYILDAAGFDIVLCGGGGEYHTLLMPGESRERVTCGFEEGNTVTTKYFPGMSVASIAFLHPDAPMEFRRVTVTNTGEEPIELDVHIEISPALCSRRDYEAHPAFARTFIRKEEQEGGILYTARDRNTLAETRLITRLVGTEGKIRVEKSAQAEFYAVMAVDDGIAAARMLTAEEATACFSDAKEKQEGFAGLTDFTARLVYRAPKKRTEEIEGRETLWRHGVSGDIPIVLVTGGEEGELSEKLRELQSGYAAIGLPFDLVFMEKEDPDIATFDAAAHLTLDPGRELHGQLAVLPATYFCEKPERMSPLELSEHCERSRLSCYNGYGGFDERNSYVIYLDAGEKLPRPWSHLLANNSFGTVVTADGGGYTWADNARLRRITPFRNEEREIPGERIIILDIASGAFIDPLDNKAGALTVTFGFGFARYELHGELSTETYICVPTELSAKLYNLTLANNSSVERKLKVWYAADISMGEGFCWDGGRPRFTSTDPHSVTVDDPLGCPGRAFLYSPDMRAEEPVAERFALLCAELCLEAGEKRTLRFSLGYTREERPPEEALRDAHRHTGDVEEYWRRITGAVRVKTRDAAFDAMMNGWLIYGTLCARVFGRTGYQQSGGAVGFRDRLQDMASVMYPLPELARECILDAAAHQFIEGDVLHWWHFAATGVRTRITDDRLFLPQIAARYARVTGDTGIFDAEIPYLSGEPLKEGQRDLYTEFAPLDKSESLYMHCVRAIEASTGLGAHGLCLIGGGDWNDAMDAVGKEGRGESVWLTMFLRLVLLDFTKVCRSRKDEERAAEYAALAERLRKSVEEAAWEEDHYLRAFFDDGRPLGSSQNAECSIDLVTQAFAVLADMDAERAKTAFESALSRLYDGGANVLKLIDPPFSDTQRPAGYINAYRPGVRENGAQYTHAAVWMAMAAAKLGRTEDAKRIFDMCSPAARTLTREAADIYAGEPYAVAGDIRTEKEAPGRAGWTWYTGSASWLFVAGLECMPEEKDASGKK